MNKWWTSNEVPYYRGDSDGTLFFPQSGVIFVWSCQIMCQTQPWREKLLEIGSAQLAVALYLHYIHQLFHLFKIVPQIVLFLSFCFIDFCTFWESPIKLGCCSAFMCKDTCNPSLISSYKEQPSEVWATIFAFKASVICDNLYEPF